MEIIYANTEIKRGVEEALPQDLAQAVSNVLQGVALTYCGVLGNWEEIKRQREGVLSKIERRTYNLPNGRVHTEVTRESRGEGNTLETQAKATVTYLHATHSEETSLGSMLRTVLEQYNFKVQSPQITEEGVQI